MPTKEPRAGGGSNGREPLSRHAGDPVKLREDRAKGRESQRVPGPPIDAELEIEAKTDVKVCMKIHSLSFDCAKTRRALETIWNEIDIPGLITSAITDVLDPVIGTVTDIKDSLQVFIGRRLGEKPLDYHSFFHPARLRRLQEGHGRQNTMRRLQQLSNEQVADIQRQLYSFVPGKDAKRELASVQANLELLHHRVETLVHERIIAEISSRYHASPVPGRELFEVDNVLNLLKSLSSNLGSWELDQFISIIPPLLQGRVQADFEIDLVLDVEVDASADAYAEMSLDSLYLDFNIANPADTPRFSSGSTDGTFDVVGSVSVSASVKASVDASFAAMLCFGPVCGGAKVEGHMEAAIGTDVALTTSQGTSQPWLSLDGCTEFNFNSKLTRYAEYTAHQIEGLRELAASAPDGAKPVDLVDGAKRVESARGTIQARERALWADSLLRAQNSLQVNQTIRDELSAQDAAAFLELVRNEKVQDLAEEGWHLAPPGLSCQESCVQQDDSLFCDEKTIGWEVAQSASKAEALLTTLSPSHRTDGKTCIDYAEYPIVVSNPADANGIHAGKCTWPAYSETTYKSLKVDGQTFIKDDPHACLSLIRADPQCNQNFFVFKYRAPFSGSSGCYCALDTTERS
ncbi:hypothetical protein AB1Y20_011750 [Prymnesium parvum]|uniref:Uncharacterized protein n=1 Tax=Prymnesium parvum TaxID=97485 RepID=A0AB34IHF4_PRYPA